MERFSWWRMEQVQHPLSRALCGAFCSILHHVKRSMSHPPNSKENVLLILPYYNSLGKAYSEIGSGKIQLATFTNCCR